MTQPARTPEAAVDPLFIERWSPRAFQHKPISDADVSSLFEAARWAPSSSNEQPWLFLYARSETDRARFKEFLFEKNWVWASHAPLLLLVCARRHTQAGKENRTALFDTGSAWMNLALQARKLGLDSHGMAGFDEQKSYSVMGVPSDKYQAIAVIAVGYRDEGAANLADDVKAREQPNGRKPLAEVAQEGVFRE